MCMNEMIVIFSFFKQCTNVTLHYYHYRIYFLKIIFVFQFPAFGFSHVHRYYLGIKRLFVRDDKNFTNSKYISSSLLAALPIIGVSSSFTLGPYAKTAKNLTTSKIWFDEFFWKYLTFNSFSFCSGHYYLLKSPFENWNNSKSWFFMNVQFHGILVTQELVCSTYLS